MAFKEIQEGGIMYNIKLLNTPTGTKLMMLLDRMEQLLSKLYHSTKNDEDDEYMKVFEEINKLKVIRRTKLSKRQTINKSY